MIGRPKTLGDFLQREPFTLAMSSGFFSFFAHAGMSQALIESGCEPSAYLGSSAGALVGSALAAGHTPGEIRERFIALKKDDFWDPRPIPYRFGLLQGERFRGLLRDLLPPYFQTLKRPLAVSVFDVATNKTRALSRGPLPSAIHASCAVPLMFEPVRRRGRLLLDGGIKDRPGLLGLPQVQAAGAPPTVLYHHIVSRSPWRRRSSPALQIPKKDKLIGLAIRGLPRLGPDKLAAGSIAFERAKDATFRALDMPFASDLRTREYWIDA